MRQIVCLEQAAIKTNKITAWIRHTHSLEQAHHGPSLHLVNCLPFSLSPSDSLPESAWKNASRWIVSSSQIWLHFVWDVGLDVGAYSSRHILPDHPLTDAAESMTREREAAGVACEARKIFEMCTKKTAACVCVCVCIYVRLFYCFMLIAVVASSWSWRRSR